MLLFDDYLLVSVDIDALLRRFPFELAAAEVIPRVSPIRQIREIRGPYPRLFIEVQDEGLDGAGRVACREVAQQLEVSALGTDGHGAVGPIERVLRTQVQYRVIARAADADGRVGAGEGEDIGNRGVVSIRTDGHACEYGICEGSARVVPLDDEWCAGWNDAG